MLEVFNMLDANVAMPRENRMTYTSRGIPIVGLVISLVVTNAGAQESQLPRPKATAMAWVDANQATLKQVSDDLWTFSEVGLREFKSNERLEPADLETKQMQYLYPEGEAFVFMDTSTYEQVHLQVDQLGENRFYLTDSMMVEVLFYDGRAIGVTPPIFVELKVVQTEPGFKGDTSSNATKPAKLESGLETNVPLFVNEGEYLKIDTRTGAYVERVKK